MIILCIQEFLKTPLEDSKSIRTKIKAQNSFAREYLSKLFIPNQAILEVAH